MSAAVSVPAPFLVEWRYTGSSLSLSFSLNRYLMFTLHLRENIHMFLSAKGMRLQICFRKQSLVCRKQRGCLGADMNCTAVLTENKLFIWEIPLLDWKDYLTS